MLILIYLWYENMAEMFFPNVVEMGKGNSWQVQCNVFL